MNHKQLHVAILSSPGMGHLTPAILLGNRLLNYHNLAVTILAVTTPAQPQLIADTKLPIIQIPAADISAVVPPDAKVFTRLCATMHETIPTIRTTLAAMNPRPNVLIGDIFSTESWTVADELGMPRYAFVTGNAWFTAYLAYSPVLDEEVVGQYVDQTEPFDIPGCKPVRPEDVVDPMLDRSDDSYLAYLQKVIETMSADGMLINTWEALEPESLCALRNNDVLKTLVKDKPVYTIGPINKQHEPVGLKMEVVEWLNEQPENSVVYVSFGSGGTLSAEQITELAWGLELSRHRFIWVVRPPAGHSPVGSYLTTGAEPDLRPLDYFPDGFLTRTQKVGFVLSDWGPQVEILNHPSVGGFLTHCGWNSVLESISGGVPMIAWPLYAEQRLNATMLTEELKVAVRPRVLPTKEVVRREEVEKMVRVLMESEEGREMRKEVKKLKDAGEATLGVNGSSYVSVCEFIEDCWSRIS